MLAEPPLLALFCLGLLALSAGGLWLRYRKWPLLAAAALLLVLLLAWVAAGLLIETPRKEAERRVKAMAEALGEKNWEKFGENVSDRFAAGTMTKADLKAMFEHGAGHGVTATVWDIMLTDPPRVTDTEVVLQFEATAKLPTGEPLPRRFEVTFGKDPDGKFRLRGYEPFLPNSKTKATLP